MEVAEHNPLVIHVALSLNELFCLDELGARLSPVRRLDTVLVLA